MNRIKNVNIKIVLTLAILLIVSFFNLYSVQATGPIDAIGDRPTVAGAGMWIEIEGSEGTSQAWNEFLKRPSAYNVPNTIIKVNGMGSGFMRPDGTREAFSESCKRSQFIWYYGNGTEAWTNNGFTYKKLHWYTQGRGTNKAHWLNPRGVVSEDVWSEYINSPDSRWTGGEVVIVCSGTFRMPMPPRKVDLTITAKSGSFDYTGKPHTVSGDNITSGTLKSGHTYTSTTKETRTDEGKYAVKVEGVSIVDSANKSVLDQYNITKRDGTLTIKAKPITEERERPDNTVETRCVADNWESWVSGPTWLDLIVTPTFTVETGSLENQSVLGIYTKLGTFANDGKFQNLKTLSEWNTWKSKFVSIRDTDNNDSPTLNLSNKNKDGLSRYGGVVTATSRYRDQGFRVQTCQPQERVWTSNQVFRTDENGSEYLYSDTSSWSEWTDKGGKIIKDSQTRLSDGSNYHYQILVVNCNQEEFLAALNASTLGITESKIGDGRGSSMMITAPTTNQALLPFGQTSKGVAALNRTGTRAFYTDGTSCEGLFTCTSNLLASAQHDAKNNKGSAPSFDSSEGVARSSADGDYLVFFRDNLDRKVRADVFYPQNEENLADIFIDSNKAALETFVEIDRDGTPEIGITTIAPWKVQREPIGGGIEAGRLEAKFMGSVNEFTMKSQWSSEENKPHKLAIDWKYLATMQNRVPGRLNRFGVTSTQDIVYTEELPVYCEFNNNPGKTGAYYSTRPFSNPNGTQENPVKPSRTSFVNSIKALFTRSVSDTNN